MEMKVVCPPLVEPYPIMEVYATGIRRVRDGGKMVRITFYSEQTTDDGNMERVIVARVVMSKEDYHATVRKMVGAPMVMS